MKAKGFIAGLCVGAGLGVLATIGCYQAAEGPAHLEVSGIARVDTTTHQDSSLDNRVYLEEPVFLQGPVYLESETIDINDLYKFADKPVKVAGPVVDRRVVKDGYTVIELDVKSITPIKDPQRFQ